MPRKILLATLLFGLLLPLSVQAAGPSESCEDNTELHPNICKAMKLIRSDNVLDWTISNSSRNGRYVQAVALLKEALEDQPDSPDVYSLLGLCHRKMKRYEESEGYYQTALRLDPQHKGAHEYIGELYLTLKNLPKAEEHLQVLDEICRFGCAEYNDLLHAIERYKKRNAG